MPIHYKEKLPPVQILVWNHTEPEKFFQQALVLNPMQQEKLDQQYKHVTARLDWLASRHALQLLCGQHCSSFYKDTAGKLRVSCNPFYYSISHSGTYVAAVQAATTVGVDIQIPSSKLSRIAHKYIAPTVLSLLQTSPSQYQDYLHYYWGIKEALFKAYGRGQVNFIEHLHILPFEAKDQGYTLGRLQKPPSPSSSIGEETWYKIFYKKTTDYYLCLAIALQ